jgi:hypothetical protein
MRLKQMAIMCGAAVWLVGLANQVHSTSTTVTYLVVSAGIAALAWL